ALRRGDDALLVGDLGRIRGELRDRGLQRGERRAHAVVRLAERRLHRLQLLLLDGEVVLRRRRAAKQPVVRILVDARDRLHHDAGPLRPDPAQRVVARRADDRRRLLKVDALPRGARRVDVRDVVRRDVRGLLVGVEGAAEDAESEKAHARLLTMTLPSGGGTIPRRRYVPVCSVPAFWRTLTMRETRSIPARMRALLFETVSFSAIVRVASSCAVA